MRVEAFDHARKADWDAYVASRADAGPMAHFAWSQIVGSTFHVTPFSLAAFDDQNQIAGVLNGYATDSFLTGPHVTTFDGGALADSPEAITALYESAGEMVTTTNSRYLLQRGGPDPVGIDSAGSYDTVRTVVNSTCSFDDALKRLSSNNRRKFRKAEKNGFTVALIDNPQEVMDLYYDIYAGNVRDLGTPTMGIDLFFAMTARLPEQVKLFAVSDEKETMIGGMLAVTSGRSITSLYVAVRRELLPFYPTYALYGRVIEWACAQPKIDALDLGRSTIGSGVHQFKQIWGGGDIIVPYTHRFAAQGVTIANMREGEGMAQKVWRKLPRYFTDRIGPIVRRRLPFA